MRYHHEIPPEAEPPRVSRRSVVRGAAWSVPVIVVAAAAPALAASPSDSVTVSSSVNGCTFDTNPAKNRRAVVTFHGNGASAVVITSVTESGTSATSVAPTTFTPTSAGQNVTVRFTTGDANTHDRTLAVTYTVGGGASITTSVTVTGLATTCT